MTETPSRPENHVIILFGATGDLARRKLLPGLFHLAAAGLMPDRYRIVGTARSPITDAQFRDLAHEAITTFGTTEPTGETWQAFRRTLSFVGAGPTGPSLVAAIDHAKRAIGGSPGRLFHLAVPPAAFESTVSLLGAAGLAPGSRVIIEKPFGTDLRSARALNKTVNASFDESQVFRIDHFLGKESVDNILAFRFANGLFEPAWNRRHISYVQIDVPETLSIEGRADFYDHTGAYRDMIVTHLFQVLGFVAMEPPTTLGADHLRARMARVFDALRPVDVAHVVRGQYAGYRDEPGVASDSQTETMAAVRVEIDNRRWAGVPFFLRSGKRLGASRQTVTLGFHQPPLHMFPIDGTGRWNEVVIDFADPGSITVDFLAKVPGAEMRLAAASMTFRYADSFRAGNGLEGYERLILDAMLGDQSLFTHAGAVERLWEISEPLLENPPPVQPYAPASWGPQPSVDELIEPYRWRLRG
ncbi:glucose-6-phosphate dehydrogenase [Virgisporangium aurantiacum]|uniref:Glucose-6-phosphate 1-dehydrogenase n=1 Tax=Virgisporangium aurantiacum TaxID=175570 RepID=A0A8J4DYE5_9ACTN|nr:glucose-6-phosphate dehydrogenase [Virgisporangium aurantiacum]GIJ54358.1 glucose-6-phosphate 1-dehydrogenase [Virgisporangium aurantiacum]